MILSAQPFLPSRQHAERISLDSDADRARHHLSFAEAGKPDAQIKRVSHRGILARLLLAACE
jgi:hypothetical protein